MTFNDAFYIFFFLIIKEKIAKRKRPKKILLCIPGTFKIAILAPTSFITCLIESVCWIFVTFPRDCPHLSGSLSNATLIINVYSTFRIKQILPPATILYPFLSKSLGTQIPGPKLPTIIMCKYTKNVGNRDE